VARNRRKYPLERLGALSDGVFAIALTLLVLELKLPPQNADASLSSMLLDNGHELVGWVVSFIVLARFWAVHHDALAEMDRCSARTIFTNFAFLGTISLIPFAAHLVGEYELSEPLVEQIFSGLIALNALTLGAFISSAERDNRMTSAEHRRWSMRAVHHLLIVPIIAVVSGLLALVQPGISLAIWGLESVLVIIALSVGMGDPDPDSTDQSAQAQR
jgi:uncharacterized membrane protein